MGTKTNSEVSTHTNALLEAYKLTHDTCKHLTTLSSGSIVILATFMTKAPAPKGSFLLIWSMVFFITTVLASVTEMYFLALSVASIYSQQNESRLSIASKAALLIAFGSFTAGLTVLVRFIMANL